MGGWLGVGGMGVEGFSQRVGGDGSCYNPSRLSSHGVGDLYGNIGLGFFFLFLLPAAASLRLHRQHPLHINTRKETPKCARTHAPCYSAAWPGPFL